MEDIENMMKCRAIFLYSIGLLLDDISIIYDNRFDYLLRSFLDNYLKDNFDIFNVLYYLKKDENGNIYIYEEEEWTGMLYEYLWYLSIHDNKKIIKMYDDVGNNVVKKISDLVGLFYDYVMILRDMSLVKVKS